MEKKWLFPKTDKWRELQISKEAVFSVTPPQYTKIITENISRVMEAVYGIKKNEIVITDASSCVGGDAIAFARTFKHVNCVEFQKDHLMMLKNNLNIYNLHNTTFYLGSYEDYYNKLKQDVIYMDPPWGGLDYKKAKNLRLKYGETPIEDLVLRAASKFIVLKLPKNYDIKYLQKKLPGVIVTHVTRSNGSVIFLLCYYYN